MSFLDKIKDMSEMRKQAKQLSDQLSKEVVVGSASGGFFRVTMDGNQSVVSVEISDEIVGDKERLERCAKEAFSRAHDELKKLMVSKFSSYLK